MEELTKIAKLLGEDNEKKLKDGITQLLLDQAKCDLEEQFKYEYSIEFEDIYDEVKKEIKAEIKEKLKQKYMESVNKKMDEWLGEMECKV